MSWRDLLQNGDEKIVSPWIGGRSLRLDSRRWGIDGRLPDEHGWYTFSLSSRKATVAGPTEGTPDVLRHVAKGYLVGDHFIPDETRVEPKIEEVAKATERVYLVDPGLDRFARVSVGRSYEGGPLVFRSQEFPLGPEDDVVSAYLDQVKGLDDIKGVPPALDVAFRIETWRRAETEKRRREEEERRQREERRRQLLEQMGDGNRRRELAKVDLAQALKAALAVGGAEYLDHRKAPRGNEIVVTFRLNHRRFECVCGPDLGIVDAGICLTAHYDDPDFDSGTKGDTWLTIESLPSVILEAERTGKLVVFRHVD